MPQPNFLIIGAPKCGTTALYTALALHPQIYMTPVKEPRFFAFIDSPPDFAGPGADAYQRETVTNWAAYVALFAAATDQRALGEASPVYLTNYQPERTADNISSRIPEMRLIAVLRQPVDRAYSQFVHQRQLGYESLADFCQALTEEEGRIAANWRPGCRYWFNGLYARNLAPYFSHFPKEQIHICLYDDLCARPQDVLSELCGFLDVDPVLAPVQIPRRNMTTWPRSRVVESILGRSQAIKTLLPKFLRHSLAARLHAWNRVKPPRLNSTLRSELTLRYRDEILHLQDLIQRDLNHWFIESVDT